MSKNINKNDTLSDESELVALLVDIKKLLVLALLKSEMTTEEIGVALGVSYKTIERLVPRKKKK